MSNIAVADGCTPKSHRHVIRFYDYYGTATSESRDWFEQFRGVVDGELSSINAAINSPMRVHDPITAEPSRDSGGTLHAEGRLDAMVSVKVMNTDPSILELLDGWIQAGRAKGTGAYIVHSEIYVLARPSETSMPPVSEDYLFDATQYDSARSVHLAALYYALSVEAEIDACRAQQIKFLSKAAEIVKDVKSKGSGIQLLRDRIAADQRTLGVPR
jgi:hypothetical protein